MGRNSIMHLWRHPEDAKGSEKSKKDHSDTNCHHHGWDKYPYLRWNFLAATFFATDMKHHDNVHNECAQFWFVNMSTGGRGSLWGPILLAFSWLDIVIHANPLLNILSFTLKVAYCRHWTHSLLPNGRLNSGSGRQEESKQRNRNECTQSRHVYKRKAEYWGSLSKTQSSWPSSHLARRGRSRGLLCGTRTIIFPQECIRKSEKRVS